MVKLSGNKVRSIAIQILVISLISCTMGEVALRVYNHFNPSYLFDNESRNKQFRGKPFASDGEFKLNSLGFKTRSFYLRRKRFTVSLHWAIRSPSVWFNMTKTI